MPRHEDEYGIIDYDYEKPSDEQILNDVTDAKLANLSIPGHIQEFDPDEAELAGAFIEDAMSLEDAEAAMLDDEG